ncbi:ferredoxin--NADP reductase [soil metagenome]
MDPESYELEVVDVVEETSDAHSITFAIPTGAAAEFTYRPGQFLTVAVPSDQTGVAARCYSLSSSPGDTGAESTMTITVKRTVDGYASNWICDHVGVGDTLRVLPPSGIFTPASLDADLLLFAGGSGVTPIMSITRTALARGTGRIAVFYANRDERSVIFAKEFAELSAAHPERLQVVHWLESVQGLPSQAQVRAIAADHLDRDAFVCGPAPFMKLTIAALRELEFPRERRHQEKFVSLGGNPFGDLVDVVEVEVDGLDEVVEIASSSESDAQSDARSDAQPAAQPAAHPAAGSDVGVVRLEVELDGETHVYDDWHRSTTMLDHVESHGLKAPYSCREGECSACAVRLVEGEVSLAHNDVLDEEDLADGIRLACQATPVSDVVRVTYS